MASLNLNHRREVAFKYKCEVGRAIGREREQEDASERERERREDRKRWHKHNNSNNNNNSILTWKMENLFKSYANKQLVSVIHNQRMDVTITHSHRDMEKFVFFTSVLFLFYLFLFFRWMFPRRFLLCFGWECVCVRARARSDKGSVLSFCTAP